MQCKRPRTRILCARVILPVTTRCCLCSVVISQRSVSMVSQVVPFCLFVLEYVVQHEKQSASEPLDNDRFVDICNAMGDVRRRSPCWQREIVVIRHVTIVTARRGNLFEEKGLLGKP